MIEVLNFMTVFFKGISVAMIAYTFSVNSIYLLLILISFYEMRAYLRYINVCSYVDVANSNAIPPISILVPAYNEGKTIADSVKSLLQLKYPIFEVVVINDGSKDDTLQVMIDEFKMIRWTPVIPRRLDTAKVIDTYVSTIHPALYLVDKENGGKADALNSGIDYSNYPYFISLDADSLLDECSLQRIVRPILESSDDVVAIGGMVRVINGCAVQNGKVVKVMLPFKPIVLYQVVEYFRAFLAGRVGLSKLDSLLIISGAFGIFRKDIVFQVGGYNRNCVGEDMELVVRIKRYIYENKHKYRIVYLPDPICWTQAPENFRTLKKQRNRWQRGLIQSLWMHRALFLNPRYGTLGLISVPYFWVVEVFGPIIELSGYIFIPFGIIFGFIQVKYFLLFTVVSILYGINLSMLSLLLEDISFHKYKKAREFFWMSIFSVLENFGYHQLNAFWRTKALFGNKKKKLDWGQMERQAFKAK